MKLWHPLTQHALQPVLPKIARGAGAYLYTDDNQRLIDAVSSWWVVTHGHGHPAIKAAIAAQLEELEQVIFAGFTHNAAENFAAALGRVMPPSLQHVFLSDSGSTANEVALKMTLGTWNHRGEPQRHKIVVFEHSYHGATIGATSLGARGVFSQPHEQLLFDVLRIPSPAIDPSRTLEAFAQLLKTEGHEIAALFVEPLVQGAMGMKMHAAAVLDELITLARSAGVFTVFDEVMTGFGRTGTMFAFNQCNEVPNVVTLAKGITGGFLPMGATVACQELYDAFYAPDRARMLFHSTSYTGNPLACAAAAANLEVWGSEDMPAKLNQINGWHQTRLAKLAQHPLIKNPRLTGTIAAFEIGDNTSNYVSDLAVKLPPFYLTRGILLRPMGNTVYIMAPYCVTEPDLDEIYDAIVQSLALAA